MKLTFKTIAGKNFSLDVEESISILEVKAKVEESQGPDCAKELCKLVYKGKVLDDKTTVADNKMDETGFVVVFINKKKEEPAKAAPVRTMSVSCARCTQHTSGYANKLGWQSWLIQHPQTHQYQLAKMFPSGSRYNGACIFHFVRCTQWVHVQN